MSILQSQKVNPLRDWKRSSLFCSRNHIRREWDLWDEVIEIHSKGTFSSNAYFLCDWFGCGRLRRLNFPAFPTTFLLYQVLKCSQSQHIGIFSELSSGAPSFQLYSFQRLLSVTFLLYMDSWEIILKWKKIYSLGRNWGHWYPGKGAVPAAVCQTLGVIDRQVFAKGHD